MVFRPGFVGDMATFTATSGGDTMVMEVEGLGAMLTAQPILAPGEEVHVGQLLQLQVGPGFDDVQWEGGSITVAVVNGSQVAWESVPTSSPSAAGVLQVQIPSTLPPGSMRISAFMTAQPRITRCEGAGACSVPSSLGVDLNVELDLVP
jgi:hypothetical protein